LISFSNLKFDNKKYRTGLLDFLPGTPWDEDEEKPTTALIEKFKAKLITWEQLKEEGTIQEVLFWKCDKKIEALYKEYNDLSIIRIFPANNHLSPSTIPEKKEKEKKNHILIVFNNHLIAKKIRK